MNRLIKDRENTIKAYMENVQDVQDDYIKLSEDYGKLEDQYRKDVPVENQTVGYLSHIGQTEDEE